MFAVPLQVLDGFLLKLNAGDALVAIYVVGAIATLVQRSRILFTVHTVLFGLLFLVTPASLFAVKDLSVLGGPLQYKFFGLALVIVAPVLFATAER